MEFQAFILSLLLLTIVSQTDSRSLDTAVQCATTCTESSGFLEGYTYSYKYEANVDSFVESAEGSQNAQATQVLIRADMQIMALSPCEMVLMVKNPTISDPSRMDMGTADWTADMTRNPLHFSWQSGAIPDVCSANDDKPWVVNLKRGMLSSLLRPENLQQPDGSEAQITMTDVTGECSWVYDFTSASGDATSATFSKDYKSCEGRNQQLLLSHFTKYYSGSDQQSFIKSSHECDRTYSEGRVTHSECTEVHTFVPFSKEDTGVKTRVTQTVRDYNVRRTYSVETLGEDDIRRSTIVFEQEESDYSSSDISEVQSTVSTLCATMATENYKEVGEDFIKIVFLLRRLDPAALAQVYSSLNGACPRFEEEIRSMFLDALQWCGSEGCVVYAANMIESGELPDAMASRWLTSMSLITAPTVPMLRAMTAIVKSGRFVDKSYLTMGTMINRLSQTIDNCMSEPDVIIALELLERKLGVNCRTSNPEAKQEILLALRAIGNAGGFTTPSILAQCASEVANDMETRVAAVQAYRRMPCNTDRSAISQLFFENTEDSELRIGSYLAMMECPTPSFIRQAIVMLDNEPIQQVASFVWTHMNQLMESTDPLKGYIKPFLVEAQFAKKYDLDPRKFSRFYEATIFSDSLNAGATVESSLIWSPKSFVPRSGSVDLTLDVFGQAVNLLELGGRVEGVESLLKSFLGPDGFLKNHKISELLSSDAEDDDEEDDDDEVEEIPPVRVTRSSSDSRLRDIKSQHANRVPKEDKPSGSMYMRLFGNEMVYWNTKGMPAIEAQVGTIDVAPFLARLAQGSNYKYHDDMMLMNSAHMIPTSAGLPLTLAFNGTASIDVTANGRMDMTQMFSTSPSIDILGSLTPRGVVLVTGSMSVDCHVTRTGIATESSAITSWTLGGKVMVERGSRVQVKLDAPYERNTVFSFNHKLLKIVGDQKVEAREGLLGLARIESDCKPEFAGQRVCISNSMSRYSEDEDASYVLPTNGPVDITVYLEKTDTGFDHYLLTANYDSTYSPLSDIPTALNATVVMDTPNSRVNRKSSLEVHYDVNAMKFNLHLTQPNNQLQVAAIVENDLNRKAINVQYNRNGANNVFSAALEKQNELTESRWEMTSSLQTPEKVISGQAMVILDPSKKALVNMTINNLMPSPIALEVSLADSSVPAHNRLRYNGKAMFKLPGIVDSGVGFDMSIKPKLDAFSFRLDYTFTDQDEEHVIFVHKRRNPTSSSVTHWEAQQKFVCSQFPLINHHVLYNYTNGPNEVRSYVKVGVGRHAGHEDNTNFMSINQTYIKTFEDGLNNIQGSAEFLLPSYEIKYTAAVSHEYNAKQFTTSVNYNQYQWLMEYHDMREATGTTWDYVMRTEFPTPWGQIIFHDKLDMIAPHKYHLNHKISVDNTQGLNIITDIFVDNLPDNKRLEVQSRGANGASLLHYRSTFDFIEGGFETRHSCVSEYNRQVNASLRYQGQKEGGFETNAIFLYDPSIFMEMNLDVESDETTAMSKARIDYKDDRGIKRFLQLLGNKESLQAQSEMRHSGSISFTSSSPNIPVQELSASAHLEKSLGSSSANLVITMNRDEILGGDFGHTYEITDDNSGVNTVSATMRQQILPYAPHKMATTATVTSTLNSGHTLTLNYVQNDQIKLTSSVELSANFARLTGSANQRFTEDIPEDLSFTITRGQTSVDGVVTMNGRSASLNLRKDSDSSVSATWSHNVNQLAALEVPRAINANLQWGERSSDGGQGLWFSSDIDREDFNAEAMYYAGATSRVQFLFVNNVRSLASVPSRIDAMTSYRVATTNGHLQARVTVGSDELAFTELQWQPHRLDFQIRHGISELDAYDIPRVNKLLMKDTTPGDSDHYQGQIITDVDLIHSELVVTSNERLCSIRYVSNCPVIGGNAELAIQKQTTDGSFGLTFTRDGVTKSANVRFDGDKSSNTYAATWSQDIFEDRNSWWIPNSGHSMISYTLEESSFSLNLAGNYNGVGGSISSAFEYPINKQKAIVAVTVGFAQNITDIIPNVHVKLAGKTDYRTDILTSLKYTIGADSERTVRSRLHRATSQQEDTFTARFNHNLVQLRQFGVPQGIIEELTVAQSGEGYMVTISSTINDNVQQFSVVGGFDTTSNTLKLGFAHDIPELTDLGVFRNVTLITSGSYEGAETHHTVNADGSLQLDDDVYTSSASVDVALGESDIVITTDWQQHTPLVEFGVPRRIRKVTTINYGLLNPASMSGSLELATNLERTMYDPETGLESVLRNQAGATVIIELFNWHISLAGNHDFDINSFPHSFEYDIVVSGSASGSPILHKSVAMSVTLDQVKQVASVTMNQNFDRNSFYLVTHHNVSAILQYGIPGNMSVSFQLHDNYDADLAIVYDTAEKSVGFKLDYDGNQKKLIFYFNHNFDMIVEQFGVPKAIGFESQFLHSSSDVHSYLTYQWGDEIRTGKVDGRWSSITSIPDFKLKIVHNFTTDEFFPNITLAGSLNFNSDGYSLDLRTTRGRAGFQCTKTGRSDTEHGLECTLQQNFDTEVMPALSQLESTFTLEDASLIGNVQLSLERELKLHTQFTGNLDMNAMETTLHLTNNQQFVTSDIFPVDITLDTSGSLQNGLQASVSLQRSEQPNFEVSVDLRYDIEDMTASLELRHSQNAWRKNAYIPKITRINTAYVATDQSHMVRAVIKRGRVTNTATASVSYSYTDDQVFGKVSYTQDFEEIPTFVPRDGAVNVLLGKTQESFYGQVNVTMDEVTLRHAIEGSYNKQPQELSSEFSLILDDGYLQALGVPASLGASFTSEWASGIVGSAHGHYGNKNVVLEINSDKETRASVHLNHNLDQQPNDIRVVVTKRGPSASMVLTLDGVEQDVALSGNYENQQGQVQISHRFDSTYIPNDMTLGGSFRLTPDVYISADAIVDSKQFGVSGGYEKLSDGFRVTSSLLDDVSRSVTFRKNLVPGGFSLSLDHNIPELSSLVPQSIGLSGEARLTPRPNVTASYRHEGTTQRFTAEGDVTALEFEIRHDFEILPLPRHVALKMSGTREPLQGSFKLVVDEISRSASASVDPENLVATFMHSIPELPLPGSLKIELSGSASPPSGTVRVTVDGIPKEASATLDLAAMRGSVSHNAVELDNLLIPRDIIVGLKGSMEPMSGELYISIDGLVRKVGGSVNRRRGLLSLFQSAPEVPQYLPKNITLAVSGTMEPLEGSITLTMDDVVRQMSGQINTRSLLFMGTHSFPELDSYIPNDIRATFGFTAESVHGSVSYTKQGNAKNAQGSVNFSPNHVRIHASQTILESEEMPSEVGLELSGSLEFYNFTAAATYDDHYVNLNGNVMTGLTSDAWYGIALSAQHNIDIVHQTLDFPSNMEVELKGRKSGASYEAAVVLNLIVDHDYQGVATITPTRTENNVAFIADYTHTYNGQERTVQGSMDFKRFSMYSYQLVLNGEQSRPDHAHIRLRVAPSVEFSTNGPYSFQVDFEATQSIPQLTDAGVPNSITLGRFNGSIESMTARESHGAVVDGQKYYGSHDVRIESQPMYSYKLFDTYSFINPQKGSVNGSSNFTLSRSRNDDRFMARMTHANTLEANDDFKLVIFADSLNPRVTLRLKNKELQRDHGVPTNSEASFIQRPVQSGLDLSLNFRFDDMSVATGVIGSHQASRMTTSTIGNVYFDHSVPYLSDLSVPTHLAQKFVVNTEMSYEATNLDASIGAEMNQYTIWYNFTERLSSTSGSVSQVMSHNMPQLDEYLGYRDYHETYSYNVVDRVLTLNGVIELDQVRAGDYTMTYNYNNNDIHYTGRYDKMGYDFDANLSSTVNSLEFLVKLDNQDANIFNVVGNFGEGHGSGRIQFDLYETQLDQQFDYQLSGGGCGLSVDNTFSYGGHTHSATFETSPIPEDSEGFKGQSVEASYTKDETTLNAGIKAKYNSWFVNVLATLLNEFDPTNERSRVAFSTNSNGYNLKFSHGRNRITSAASYTMPDRENFDAEWSLSQNMNSDMPAESIASAVYNPQQWSASVVADDRHYLTFNVQNRQIEFAINSPQGSIASVTGTYASEPTKDMNVAVIFAPLEVNLDMVGSLSMFQKKTGNSTATFMLTDRDTNEEMHFSLYACPSGNDAFDFYGGLFAFSELHLMPFTFSTSLNSSVDAERETYNCKLQAEYGDSTLAFAGEFAPNRFNVRLTQPWSETASTVILSGSNVTSSDNHVKTIKVQWGSADKSLEFVANCTMQDLREQHTISLTQPSKDLGLGKLTVKSDKDQRTPDLFITNFGVDLDGSVFGIGVRYAGDLPQALGQHDLTVVIRQPFFYSIPETFTTRGVMTISSSGLYESDWRILVKGEEAVSLVKNYRPTSTGHTFDLLWRLAYYDVPFLRYLKIDTDSSNSGSVKQGRGFLQIDDMPKMGFEMRTGELDDGEQINKTMKAMITTGPLSKWLLVRTLGLTSWYSFQQQGSRQIPAFSATMDLDGNQYHVDGNYNVRVLDHDKRFMGDLTLTHPHDLEIFGMHVPRVNTGSAKLTAKPNGIRLILTYDNELIEQVKTQAQYRMAGGDRMLDGSITIKYSPVGEPDDVTGRIEVVRNENGFDKTATLSFAYPASNIDSHVIISGVDADDRIATEVIVKNYNSVERKLWKLALAYAKQSRVISVTVNSPGMEETTMSGDLTQIITQAGHLMKTLASEAASTGLQFVYGYSTTRDGLDMWIGYMNNDEPIHTLHLLVGVNAESAYALLEVQRDGLSQAKIGKVSINLVDERLIQVEFKGYPVVTDFLRKMLSTCDNEVTRKINWLADQLVDFLLSCRSAVSGSDNVRQMNTAAIDRAIAKINEMRVGSMKQVSSIFNGASDNYDSSHTIVQVQLQRAVLMLQKAVDQLMSTVAQPFADVVDQHYGAFLRQIGTEFKSQLSFVARILAKVNADEVFNELIDEVIEKTSAFILTNGEATFIACRRPLSELIAITDSAIIINIPLKFELDHFVPVPTIDEIKAWLAETALAVQMDAAVNKLYAYVDQYYKIRSVVYMSREELLPPFKGHAFVSGFDHFSTFDKRHFQYSSDCPSTVVLVTDTRTNKFTVAMTYGDLSSDTKPSIELIVDNRKVSVFSDYTVQVNGHARDTPLHIDNIAVTLEGEVVHLRHVDGDVDVACNFKTELCTVDVSPYYFGSTGGMLGLFNNEPSDDFMAPDLRQVADPAELASEWETSSVSCASRNSYRPCASNNIPETCADLFKSSSSPFRSCFPVVDPAEFMRMCQDDVCDSGNRDKSCAASAAYLYRCKLAGAPLVMPHQCQSCQDAHGHHFAAGRTRAMSVTGVDLVFVVQESTCLRRTVKSMKRFTKKLATKLHGDRLRDSRFYVVGFGADEAPHTFTMQGRDYTTNKKTLFKAIRKMDVSDSNEGDALAAVSYATTLKFRAGVKPIIVLLSCGECSQETAVSFGNVEWQVKKLGADFHHIPNSPIRAGRKSMYGFDTNRAFSKQDVASSVVKASKTDACVPLATVTGGSVWDASQMSDNNFQTRLSTYISEHADAGSRVTCTCQVNDVGVATSVCSSSPR